MDRGADVQRWLQEAVLGSPSQSEAVFAAGGDWAASVRKGTWRNGITSASHAEGPGSNPSVSISSCFSSLCALAAVRRAGALREGAGRAAGTFKRTCSESSVG